MSESDRTAPRRDLRVEFDASRSYLLRTSRPRTYGHRPPGAGVRTGPRPPPIPSCAGWGERPPGRRMRPPGRPRRIGRRGPQHRTVVPRGPVSADSGPMLDSACAPCIVACIRTSARHASGQFQYPTAPEAVLPEYVIAAHDASWRRCRRRRSRRVSIANSRAMPAGEHFAKEMSNPTGHTASPICVVRRGVQPDGGWSAGRHTGDHAAAMPGPVREESPAVLVPTAR